MARPLVNVYDLSADKDAADGGAKTKGHVRLPAVFRAPIRPDVVQFIHDQMRMNRRQPYAVSEKAGGWSQSVTAHTPRRSPDVGRVVGHGPRRGAHPARARRRHAPLGPGGLRQHVPRRAHVRADEGVAPLAPPHQPEAAPLRHLLGDRRQRRARAGHGARTRHLGLLRRGVRQTLQGIDEVPLVLSDKVESITKTKEAVTVLRRVHAWADVEKVIKSKRYRAGKGKRRNRRYKMKKGPLIVYAQDNGIKRAFRNVPGVDFMQVDRMSLLKLAPGGHLGRFVIWTESAFRKLDSIYGTWKAKSATKADWNLPQSKVGCSAAVVTLPR